MKISRQNTIHFQLLQFPANLITSWPWLTLEMKFSCFIRNFNCRLIVAQENNKSFYFETKYFYHCVQSVFRIWKLIQLKILDWMIKFISKVESNHWSHFFRWDSSSLKLFLLNLFSMRNLKDSETVSGLVRIKEFGSLRKLHKLNWMWIYEKTTKYLKWLSQDAHASNQIVDRSWNKKRVFLQIDHEF